MTQQEHIDRDLRMLLGDLQVQLIFAKARIAELEEQAVLKANGDAREHQMPFTSPPPAN